MLYEVITDVHGFDGRAVAQENGPFDGVGQLADVSGPGVGLEENQNFRRQRIDLLVHGAGQPPQQVIRERIDALGALPQRRQMDSQHVDPVIQIFTKFSLAHQRFRITSYNVCYTKLLRIAVYHKAPPVANLTDDVDRNNFV